MKIFLAAAVLTVSLTGFTACWSADSANNANQSNAANQANTANAANQTANAANTEPAKPPMSPTETLKALNEAAKKKDTEAIKKTLSKGTMEIAEQKAKDENTTVDELFKHDKESFYYDLPELGEEEISGETATVELKNRVTKQWEKVPFVLENGEWKLALDKYIEDLENRLAEEQEGNSPGK